MADPAERERLIAARCAGNPGLQARVEELLRAAAQAGGILDQPLEQFLSTDIAPPISESVGTVIGPYKLMEQIGEGGFGLVSVAEQQEPLRRRVALGSSGRG